MKNFFDKIFFRTNNLDNVSKNIRDLTIQTKSFKIFEAISNYSKFSEIRYVGGCLRKIINNEKINDLDFATNLEPKNVCEALKSSNIKYYETGVEHGTVSAIIDENKYEITTLREDISTDGRHAKVSFSKDWRIDSLRRDFTFNSIYSDKKGNLFDPNNGKKDLENGLVNFIGDPEKRIKEDYLRILRYIRFYLYYSKHPHNLKIIKIIKINIGGISKLSKERLLNELRKIIKIEILEKLSADKVSLELLSIIFPELINLKSISKLNFHSIINLKELDFIFLLSLMIIDGKDNVEYFLYKYNISKIDQNRIKNIDEFYSDKILNKEFSESNMNNIFYFKGKQAVIDILNFKMIKLKKLDNRIKKLYEEFKNKTLPKMPIKAEELINKYNFLEGKDLGDKIKLIEKKWVNNNFKISDKQIEDLVKN